MCLILFSWEAHDPYRLVVAANRDEFHARPTRAAHWWDDDPSILGGRDLESGGTWMAISRSGRIAAVTNFSEGADPPRGARSRGLLVVDFLKTDNSTGQELTRMIEEGDHYQGFSLIGFDGTSLGYVSNRAREPEILSPGIYGLANALLDSDWPKIERGKSALDSILGKDGTVDQHAEALLDLLRDEEAGKEIELPHSDRDDRSRQRLSPIFIRYPTYGTRASTVLLIENDGAVTFIEQSWNERGRPGHRKDFRFSVERNEG